MANNNTNNHSNRKENKKSPSVSSASHRNDHNGNDKDDNDDQQRHELDILPPHLALQAATANPKLAGTAPKTVRLINQQVKALAALQETLDVARHDPLDVVNLALHIGDGIIAAAGRGAVFDHEAPELAVEAGGTVVGEVREVRAGWGQEFEEAVADLEEEAERDAAAQACVGDDEERQPAGARGRVVGVVPGRLGYVVDVMRAMGVGKLLARGVFDLGKNEGGEGRGLRRGGCRAFAENGVIVGDT